MVAAATRRKSPKKTRSSPVSPSLIALDTETTGLDLWHGCKPFFVSTVDGEGVIRYWEWDVNPFTREPQPPALDLEEIRGLLQGNPVHPCPDCGGTGTVDSGGFTPWGSPIALGPCPSCDLPTLALHNAKFDVRALEVIGIRIPSWGKVEDTLVASHVLASAESHKLKDLALQYLDIPDDDQKELREAVISARRIGKKLGFRIAAPSDPHFPAVKRSPKSAEGEGFWPMDMWLPRAVAKAENYPESHPWWNVVQRYAITDAERTLGLHLFFRDALEDQDLLAQYEERRKLLGVVYRMEHRGITTPRVKLAEAKAHYAEAAEDARTKAVRLADGKLDNLNSPKQLQGVLFHHFKVKPIKETKTGYSTQAADLETMRDGLPSASKPAHFIRNLIASRKYAKALEYLDGYESSGIGYHPPRKGPRPLRGSLPPWLFLHPNFNITGTDTTRFSSNNPNAQNISKKEGFNLRQVFGPLPGREWYSLDYSNIELRIFAYTSGDKRLISAFESGDSVHLVICSELYPKEWAACLAAGESFKKKYESTFYQWVKNGNFSLIYGAGETKADATYHLPGAYRRIRRRFPLIDSFMRAKYEDAVRLGYVTTLGGYRLQVPKDGPHKAVNYFVQGTAGWCMVLAMNRIENYLLALNRELNLDPYGPDAYYVNMTIHDELDFDFPIHPRNREVIRTIKDLMEESGRSIGIATPVDVDLIRNNWAEEEKVSFQNAL